MANTAHEPVPPVPPAPAPAAAHAELEQHTGIYGFFRRNQKKLLYTVGLFVLVTFSVSGPMIAAVRDWFAPLRPMPSILVGGERVHLQPSDYQFGSEIARNIRTLVTVVPPVDAGDSGTSELGECYAILRRVAVTAGIDVSMAEVDRAIDTMRERGSVQTPQQLAKLHGFQSLAQYRELLAEALRIGTLIRLETLALDNSDARILQRIITDKEKITFKVATFDEKALDEKLKAAGGVSDDDLKKWLDGKAEPDKQRMQVYDTNRVELKFGGVMLDAFDAAQWQDEALKDFTVGDQQLQKVYEQEKEQRFKKEDKSYKPLDEVKPEVTKLVQSERVMQHVLGKLRDKQNEFLKPETEDLQRCHTELEATMNAVSAAKAKLAQNAEDAAAKEELRLAEQPIESRQAAVKTAETKLAEKRATFDFQKEFGDLTKDKTGFVQKEFTGKRNADDLKDLEKDGVGLGEWPLAIYATYLQNKGDLSSMPGRSTKAAFVYQVKDLEVRPLKPWDKLKPLLEGAFFTEKAKTQAEENKKKLEDALLRLAKAKMPDKVAEIEGKRAAKVDEKLAAWEKQAQADLEKANATLANPDLGKQAQVAWTKKRDEVQAQLAKKDDKKKEFDTEVGKQIEADIGVEAKKFHAEVLDAAAAEAGFTVADVGPHPRELSSKPRFDKNHDHTVVFLFRSHAEMKEGESTGIVQDVTNRRWHVACCTKVEPLTIADVERREFQQLRSGGGWVRSFASLQAMESYGQAFTKKALETRYSYQMASDEQKPEPPKAPEPPQKK